MSIIDQYHMKDRKRGELPFRPNALYCEGVEEEDWYRHVDMARAGYLVEHIDESVCGGAGRGVGVWGVVFQGR